jgi:hypothetical protein
LFWRSREAWGDSTGHLGQHLEFNQADTSLYLPDATKHAPKERTTRLGQVEK